MKTIQREDRTDKEIKETQNKQEIKKKVVEKYPGYKKTQIEITK